MALFKKEDGTISKGNTIQTLTFIVLTVILIFAVYTNKPYAVDLYLYYAGFGGFLTASKGSVAAYRAVNKNRG